MRVIICECKYKKSCVLILIETYFCTRVYRRLPFKKFSLKEEKERLMIQTYMQIKG